MNLTLEKRSKVITLNEYSVMTQRQITYECSISLGVVKIIRQNLKLVTISLQRNSRCVRKPKASLKDDAILCRISQINYHKYSSELQKYLKAAWCDNSRFHCA